MEHLVTMTTRTPAGGHQDVVDRGGADGGGTTGAT
jgi:hypothetical protein